MKLFKAILATSIFILTSSFITTNPNYGYKIGDKATDFELKNVNGKMVSLSDYKDSKGFIVIFTCNTCPYSVRYEDRIIALDKKYKEKGFPVIAINPNDPTKSTGDSFKSMQKRAKDKGFTFPYLQDEGQKIYPQYGASRTPHVFLLNKENDELKVAYIGAIDNNSFDAKAADIKYVEDAVESLIAGKTIEIKTTKAIGCTIKKA